MSTKDKRATKGKTHGAAAKELANKRAPIIRVKVTQEIIDASCRKNSGHCMVSEAVLLAAPWARHIASDLQTIRLTHPKRGLRYIYLTPRTAQLALIEFDKGNMVRPFHFFLRGAHITTSYKKVVTEDGSKKTRAVHKLGRKKITTTSMRRMPDIIGGVAEPKRRPSINASQVPGGTFRREYGMRAFTGGFDIKDTPNLQLPIGGPSLSDK